MKARVILPFFMVLLLIACSNNTIETSEKLHIVEDFFQKDKAISDFKIDHFEFSHKDTYGHDVYQITYSMKPANPDTFILAGSGTEGEDGWIINRSYFVTFKNGGDLYFSTSP